MAVDLEKLRAEVLKTIVEVSGKTSEKVKLDFKLRDNEELDEFDIIQIVMTLEEVLNVEIVDEDIEKLSTAEELVAYIYSKLDVTKASVKTDAEILATKEEELTDEEKVKKVAIVKKQEEDVLLAKPEAELTEEEKELVVKIKESRVV